jgi:uncharacterized protein (TIGR02268 family)
MRTRAPSLLVLSLLLTASLASAQERGASVRNLYLSDDPAQPVPTLRVGARRATVLRFERDIDPAHTALLGWENWFEPVVASGRTVVVVPRRALARDEHFLLVVGFRDGKEQPFSLDPEEDGAVDAQVNIFLDGESVEALRGMLADARLREQRLLEENARYRREGTSVDHAFAALMSQGQVSLTPFRLYRQWNFPRDTVNVVVVNYLQPRLSKSAIVVNLENKMPHTPWRLQEVRLVSVNTGRAWPFALRMDSEQILPGTSGTIAVVTDLRGFDFKHDKLLMDFIRHDGRTEVSVLLEQTSTRKL